MRTLTAEKSFLQSCFDVPQVRNRLERGVKLNELLELREFLEKHRHEQFVQKEYGHLYEDLDFLKQAGALSVPYPDLRCFISVRPHWVAVKGYFNVSKSLLLTGEVQSRWVVNTLALCAPMMILHSDAWKIYKSVLSSARLTPRQALIYTIYILEILSLTEAPLGTLVNDALIRYVVREYDSESLLSRSLDSLLRLAQTSRIEDPQGVLPALFRNEYCFPNHSWIIWDGWLYLPMLPSWTLSTWGDEDNSGNYIEQWDFFSTEV